MVTTPSITTIRSRRAVSLLVDDLTHTRNRKPELFLDVQGTDFCIYDVGVITIFLPARDHVYTIFVDGPATFSYPGKDGTTIKGLLEDPTLCKGFFDVRKAANALYRHFGITLQGVMDIQLMQCSLQKWKNNSLRTLLSLGDCVERQLPIVGPDVKQMWRETAIKASHELIRDKGGMEMAWFTARPLPVEMRKYTMQQVQILAMLCEDYWQRMDDKQKDFVFVRSSEVVMKSLKIERNVAEEVERLLPWWESGKAESDVAELQAKPPRTMNWTETEYKTDLFTNRATEIEVPDSKLIKRFKSGVFRPNEMVDTPQKPIPPSDPGSSGGKSVQFSTPSSSTDIQTPL